MCSLVSNTFAALQYFSGTSTVLLRYPAGTVPAVPRQSYGSLRQSTAVPALSPCPITFARGKFVYKGYMLEACKVSGLSQPDSHNLCRSGELQVVCKGTVHTFRVTAHHQEPIPDGSYALLGDRLHWSNDLDIVLWAVGTFDSDNRFEKLSVLKTEDENSIEILQRLGLIGGRSLNKPSMSSIALV